MVLNDSWILSVFCSNEYNNISNSSLLSSQMGKVICGVICPEFYSLTESIR